ncbi:MAG TPA: AI-2E family transporter [Trichocoleus sp.]
MLLTCDRNPSAFQRACGCFKALNFTRVTSMIQPLNKLPRWLVWEIALPLTFLNGWLLYIVFQTFRTPLTLLVTATLLSFLLNYPVELLRKQGLNRGASVLVILLLAVGGFVLLSVALVPILLTQLQDLAANLPLWLASGGTQFQVVDQWLDAHRIPIDTSALAAQFANLLPAQLGQLPDQFLELVVGTVGGVAGVLVTAVLTLYLLLHGHDFWNGLTRWLPGDFSYQVREALREQFRNYFVGQAAIAALMAGSLTTVFFLLKIPFWLVLGLGIGALVLIPFGDTIAILLSSLLLSTQNIWLGGEVLLVSLLTDQLIDNGIAPRILGNLVGLNPVWIIIALLLGAQFGGLIGVVIAIPLAGTIKRVLEGFSLPEELTLDAEEGQTS